MVLLYPFVIILFVYGFNYMPLLENCKMCDFVIRRKLIQTQCFYSSFMILRSLEMLA